MTDDRREWYIYVLRDPRDNAVRYVGWTIDVKRRLKNHISTSRQARTYKDKWINVLARLHLKPIMEVIERGTGEWQSVEQYWVRHYRMQGAQLTNATDGGDGVVGIIVSQETREKMRQARLGRKMSPEHIEKMRQVHLGRKRSPETRERIRQSMIGRKQSPESIEKTRQANLGRKNSPEHIEKTRQANLGRKHSPETIRKLTGRKRSPETIEKMKGRKRSPEHIEKLRQVHLGRKISPETRERMSKGQLGRKHSPETIEKMKQASSGIAVRRVEDGMIFASLREAARSIDRCDESIHKAIKRGTKYAGYHWERVGETPPADPYTLDGNALMMRFD